MRYYQIIFVFKIFFLTLTISSPNCLFSYNEASVKIESYFQIHSNDSLVVIKNVVEGFIVERDGYIVTVFSSIKGACYVCADTGKNGNSGSITLYNSENLKMSNYWIDEQRDIIVFKINDFAPDAYYSFPVDVSYSDSLYYINSSGTLSECKIAGVVNTFKSIFLILNIDARDKMFTGSPLLNNKSECLGMILFNNEKNKSVYAVSSVQIENAVYHLYLNKERDILKLQLDDYVISPETLSKSVHCTVNEIKFLN